MTYIIRGKSGEKIEIKKVTTFTEEMFFYRPLEETEWRVAEIKEPIKEEV